MRRALAEALGTFFLVFAGTGAIVIDSVSNGAVSHLGVALAFGLVVMGMIAMVGDVSGAHLNPAVTARSRSRAGFVRVRLCRMFRRSCSARSRPRACSR